MKEAKDSVRRLRPVPSEPGLANLIINYHYIESYAPSPVVDDVK